MGVGCKLVQFVVYCALPVMMSTNIQLFQRRDLCWQLMFFFSGRKHGQYADQELLKSLFQNTTPDLSLKYILIYVKPSAWSAGISSKNKGKQAKRKNRMKKKKTRQKKKTEKRNGKQRRRESNQAHLHVQATPWPLHHSATHVLVLYFCDI